VLYHALFALFQPDHRVLFWCNSVLGVLALPLAAAFAARLLDDRRAGAVAALLLALVPVFVKHDNSDANNVPATLWLLGALVLWEEYLATGRRAPLVAAVPLFAFAAVARPEMPLLVPLLAALATLGLKPPRARFRDPLLVVAVASVALLVVPHALHVLRSIDVARARGALPNLRLAQIVDALFFGVRKRKYLLLQPDLYPVALLPAALYGLVERGPRLRPRLALGAMAAVALVTYELDLCRANLPRVHALGAALFTALAAAGLVRVWETDKRPLSRALVAAAVALSAAWTVRALWAPTNEQAEEEFLRAAIARLPSEPYTLVRYAPEDPEPGPLPTHRFFPDYLVRPPCGSGRVASIGEWTAAPDFDRPAYAYWGTRCYARMRDAGTRPPHGDDLQPACAALAARFRLEPVVERIVPNRGDVWLEYYGDSPTLRLGLYRLLPK
jgi:4-amino-4-deoxy-L-arabinose transferase-like glycosyltransferase